MKKIITQIVLGLLASASPAMAQGTAFTYQGQLLTASGPANGTFDLTFTLYDTNQPPGNIIAGPVTNSAVAITNPGLFTATLDFGGVFNGTPRWLEIGVRTNGGGSFVTLSPRQQMTPAPYALYAGNATMLASGVALGSGIGNLVLPNIAINSFVGGGSNNLIFSPDALIVGGSGNQIGDGTHGSVVVGGSQNVNNASYATIGGGILNFVLGPSATVGGGSNNIASGAYATVGGGEQNRASGTESTVGGGSFNVASGQDATVSGGYTNTNSAPYSFIGGGLNNNIPSGGYGAFIGCGQNNIASQYFAAVSDGEDNTASGQSATVVGGQGNTASGNGATAIGGSFNSAAGYSSLAAGYGAQAVNNNSFVWADGEGLFTSDSSDRDQQFKIQARGGVVMDVSGSVGVNPAALYVNSGSTNGVGLYVVQTNSTDACVVINTCALRSSSSGGGDIIKGFGWSSPPNFTFPSQLVFEVTILGDVYGHSFNSTSDRNAKENFSSITPEEILQKVAALPISQWNFKGDHQAVQHIGPMAQDFHAAFGLNGADDKRISLTDEGGVALAAIQGLNQKVNEKDAEIQVLQQQNESLEHRLDDLEHMVKPLADKN